MHKKCMTIIVLVLVSFVHFSSFAEAKTYKKKTRTSYAYSKKSKGKSDSKKFKNKSKKNRGKKYKRSGSGPDLKTLTTEKVDNEYTDFPDNGVNSVETKTGL